MKMKKRNVCFLIILIMLIFTPVMEINAVTSEETVNSLNTLISTYNGKIWSESFAGGSQCYAFAHKIFNTLFNRGSRQVGNGAVSSNSTCYKLNNVANDIITLGTLGPGYSLTSLEALLKKAAPGDYVQVKRKTSGNAHSMIVVSVNSANNIIEIFDANSDGKGTIKRYSQTLEKFMCLNAGVSVYRYSNYKPAVSNSDPLGAVDHLSGGINQISLGGWAYDPDDASKPVDVRIKIGSSAYTIKANSYRTGVAPTNYHGFDTLVNVNEIGTYKVNVYAVDVNNGKEKLLGSKNITIESKKSPVGYLEAIGGGENYIGLTGWAYDPDDSSKPVTIKIQLKGASSYTFQANEYRTGVAPTNYHGFSKRISVKESGTYKYEVYAVDLGKYSSGNTLIGSGTITIGKKHFDCYIDTNTEYIRKNVGAVSGLSGKLFIQGWAVDSSGIDHVEYEVLASDQKSGGVKGTCTYRDRVDVQQANPGYPKGKEGFMAEIPYSQLRYGWYYPEQMKIVLTAYCKDGQKHDIGTIEIKRTFPEKNTPTITNIQVTDKTYSGYTVKATVSDSSGIARVQFPTWTVKNDQDDIQKDWQISSSASGKISGNTVTYRVNVSDHKGESGTYKTHIYAYDKYGNCTIASGSPLSSIVVPAYVKSNGISLSETSLVLESGAGKTLIATVSPSNATDKSVTWRSSNTKVVTVDQKGNIKATGAGSAVVTVTTADGKTASCTVKVKVSVTGISLNKAEISLKGNGATANLIAVVQPANATDKTVIWETSNAAVAKVNNGTITSVGSGQAVITAKTKDGNKVAKCSVTVTIPVTIPVTGVSLNKTDLELTETHLSELLTVSVQPANATNKTVIWRCEDKSVAVVTDGTVTAVGNGNTIVSVESQDGSKKAFCNVHVNLKDMQNEGVVGEHDHNYTEWKTKRAATVFERELQQRECSICGKKDQREYGSVLRPTISVNVSNILMRVKQSTNKLEVKGLANGDYVASWKSDRPSIVKVNKRGQLTAKKKGKATITITLASGLTKKIRVTVQKTKVSTTKISGLPEEMTLQKGEKLVLRPVITPITSQDKVLYKTSNKKVASVSAKGIITGKKPGKAKITLISGKKKFIITVVVRTKK